MFGLQRTPAADASLLLNLESVLTAVFAWVAFREATDRRIVLGMLLIVLGGVVLAWQPGEPARGGRRCRARHCRVHLRALHDDSPAGSPAATRFSWPG